MSGNAEGRLSAYLDRVAAGTPVPGGGSVAAVVGALAAALGEMVANLTLGREKYADAEASLRPARDRLTALRGALLNVRGNAAMLEDRELALPYLTDADLLEQAGREAAQRAYRTAIGAAEEGGFR